MLGMEFLWLIDIEGSEAVLSNFLVSRTRGPANSYVRKISLESCSIGFERWWEKWWEMWVDKRGG